MSRLFPNAPTAAPEIVSYIGFDGLTAYIGSAVQTEGNSSYGIDPRTGARVRSFALITDDPIGLGNYLESDLVSKYGSLEAAQRRAGAVAGGFFSWSGAKQSRNNPGDIIKTSLPLALPVLAAWAAPALFAGAAGATTAAAAPLMPPAVLPSFASSFSLPAAVTAIGTKLGTSLASSLVLSTLRPKPKIPQQTAALPLTAGGRNMFDLEFPTIDWSQLGDAGMQVLVNRASSTTGAGNGQYALPMAQPMQTGFPALGGMIAGGARMLGAGGLVAGAAAAVGVLRTVGGRIVGWMLPSGVKVSRKAAVALAKSMGLSAAAGAIGAELTDLAEAVMQEHKGPRRGRGITAANMRTTKRTIGKLERFHRQIAKVARAHHR